MNSSTVWALVVLAMFIITANLAYALGVLKGIATGTKLGKAIGEFRKINRERDFASSIGRN